MMKKMSLLAVLLCMALSLGSCATQDNREYYETAQLYLGCGDYDYAAELFTQLGEYEDSADYTLYCRALEAIQNEEFSLARANLNAVNPFKSSGRYLMYLDALETEAAGDLEKALSLYEKLGTFEAADQDAKRLRNAIPEAAMKEGRTLMAKGEYAAARDIFLALDGYGSSAALAKSCTTAINKAAFEEAEKLCEEGKHLEAMAAFTALGDTLDAAERAAQCLADIHEELDARYAAVTLADAPALIEAYKALGEDAAARERIAELSARYGKNLELLTALETHPVVQLGEYPAAESGEERPVMWRVLKAEGELLTLLSETVLDAADAAQAVAVMFTEAEQAAVGEVTLPAVADLAALNDLTCSATPYALAQGAASEEGFALYWLRDSLENGLHPVIGATGALALPEADVIPGVRPMVTLSLEKIAFTNGTGAEDDPFRVQ